MSVLEAIRMIYPKLRRRHMAGIVVNTGARRVYRCCGCDSEISMSNSYPITLRVKNFISHHDETCGKDLVEMIHRVNKLVDN